MNYCWKCSNGRPMGSVTSEVWAVVTHIIFPSACKGKLVISKKVRHMWFRLKKTTMISGY